MKILFIISFIILNYSFLSQKDKLTMSGHLNPEKVITYWDKDSTIKRSEGQIDVYGVGGIGSRHGKWTFYYRNGTPEEISNFYDGLWNGSVKQFYENGKLKFKGDFFLGIPEGSVEEFYKNGNKAVEGSYYMVNDTLKEYSLYYLEIIKTLKPQKAGIWREYFENGKIQTQYHFKPGDTIQYLDSYYDSLGTQMVYGGKGEIIEKFTSGKIKHIKKYLNGVLHGEYIAYNPNGTIKEKGNYKNGLQDGLWEYHHFVSGRIYQTLTYKEGVKHGNFVEIFPNDTVSIIGVYAYGKKNGTWSYFFPNGQLDMKGNFKNEQQDSLWKYWYPSGQLFHQGFFKEGKKEDKWVFYYGNGQLWKEGNYRHDLREGEWQYYYENGNQMMQGGFQNDKEQGLWQSYFMDSKLKDEGYYDKGLMSGAWKGNHPNGKIHYEGFYERDMKTGHWKFYTEKGALNEEGDFKIMKIKDNDAFLAYESQYNEASYKHGTWRAYGIKDGKLAKEGSYTKGQQTGTWKYYYPGGQIVANVNNYNEKGQLDGLSAFYGRKGEVLSEIMYKNGRKNGSEKIYDRKGRLVIHNDYKNGVKVKSIPITNN